MKKLFLLSFFLLLLMGCGRFGDKKEKKNTDTRIVSLSKQYNEIIYALGAQEDLVAVDLSSTYPPAIKKLPTVGYHMALSLEGILSMKPTVILRESGPYSVGPEGVVRKLKKLEITMKSFKTEPTDIPSTKKLIREMGAYFNKEAEADSLCQKLDSDMTRALAKQKTYSDTPNVVIVHFGRASNVYLTVTKNSVAAKMVKWAGGKITIEGEGRMQRMTSPEVLAKANPDVILMTGVAYDKLGSMDKIRQLPGVGSTKAARNDRIYRIRNADIIYLGPRTGENVLKFEKLIHGDGAS